MKHERMVRALRHMAQEVYSHPPAAIVLFEEVADFLEANIPVEWKDLKEEMLKPMASQEVEPSKVTTHCSVLPKEEAIRPMTFKAFKIDREKVIKAMEAKHDIPGYRYTRDADSAISEIMRQLEEYRRVWY